MTPTLSGRIETRITLGLIIAMPILSIAGMANLFFIMLAIGLPLDLVYTNIQYTRWDGDWPHLHTLFAGAIEGVFLWIIASFISDINIYLFVLIYLLIWILTFVSQTVFLNTLFPYRRFKGGRIL